MSETLVQLGRRRTEASEGPSAPRREGRPEWLRIRLATPASYHQVRSLVERLNLHTVCQEARCPNIYECWGEHGTATFMILGDVCTRRCGFCAVTSGRPQAGVDPGEPEHVAEAVDGHGARATPSSPRWTATTCRTAAPVTGPRSIEAVHRAQPGMRRRGADPRLPRRARRARRRPRRRARGLLPQHGDGAPPLPQGASRQPLRPQPGSARRGRAPPRRRRVRRPRQDRHHARPRRDARRGLRDPRRHPRRRASRSSPSASTSSPRPSTCRWTAGSIRTSSPATATSPSPSASPTASPARWCAAATTRTSTCRRAPGATSPSGSLS